MNLTKGASMALVLACSFFAGGCAHYETVPNTYVQGGPWSDQHRDAAKAAFLYAVLSSNVYEDRKEFFELPASLGLVPVAGDPPDRYGYGYQVYERWRDRRIVEVIVAFRGTDFVEAEDWIYGNVGTRQRFLALETFHRVKQQYKDRGANFSVTGHSLGGSLATQVSLEYGGVDYYVFNTSPRFNYRSPVQIGTRHSIVEVGEINKILRIAGREPNQTYTPYNCSRGNPIGQHSMWLLARCLVGIAAAANSDDADAVSAANGGIPQQPPL